MTKTIEEVVREKFATGYDPVELKLSARAINEQNVEVRIEGVHYSIKGNEISFLDDKKAAEPEPDTSEGGESGESLGGGESTKGEKLSGDELGDSDSGAADPEAKNTENPETGDGEESNAA